MSRRTLAARAALLLALGGGALGACDRLLVDPAPSPGSARVSMGLTPAALQALSAGGPREAFDDADAMHVVLIEASGFPAGADPFIHTSAHLADSIFTFTPGDTIHVVMELADSVLADSTEVVLALMVKVGPDPLFVFLDSLWVAPNRTTFAPIPFLAPVPNSVLLVAQKDSLLLPDDSTRVQAYGIFATGDTIPDGQFFPQLTSLDPLVLNVTDRGTHALATPEVAGTGRVEARVSTIGGDVTDTAAIRVIAPAASDTAIFIQLETGNGFACGLGTDNRIYCWGNNAYGVFGNGTTISNGTPLLAAGGILFSHLAVGNDHVCGVALDTDLLCWGRNDSGQLGNGTAGAPQLSPVAAGSGWNKVYAGALHTCATSGLNLFCWGDNGSGQVGAGGAGPPVLNPSMITGAWAYATLGYAHTCAASTSNTVFCWGNGADGALGNGSPSSTPFPTLVPGGPWDRVSAGRHHTCARKLTTTPHMACWGRNDYGQLGTGAGPDTSAHLSPEPTAFSGDPLDLRAGSFHTCVIHNSDELFECWGDNTEGQLGLGAADALWMAIRPSRELNFTCALREDNRAFCWGDNAFGQLGDGTVADSPVPVPVLAPGGAGASPPAAAPRSRR